tara:strand:- start:1404 stop:1637 length:234 start_codon:yes stop_codon:yes gene_type:complete
MSATNKKLFEILNTIELDIEESESNCRISFSDLGVDSLDLIKFITDVENYYNVEITDDILENINSIDELRIYINSNN